MSRIADRNTQISSCSSSQRINKGGNGFGVANLEEFAPSLKQINGANEFLLDFFQLLRGFPKLRARVHQQQTNRPAVTVSVEEGGQRLAQAAQHTRQRGKSQDNNKI